MDSKDLKASRKLIDKIDNEIISLLSERSKVILLIAEIKNKSNAEIYNPTREYEILDNLNNKNKGPLDNKAIENIYKAIFEENKKMQETHVNNLNKIKLDIIEQTEIPTINSDLKY